MDRNGTEAIIIETGEIVELESYKLKGQTEQIKRVYKMKSENKEFYDKYGGFIFKEDSKRVDKLESKLTDSDISKLLYLATYLDYDSYVKFDSGRYMSKSDIKEKIGVNKNLFGAWYNKILKLGIIIEDEVGIKINNGYYIKGEISKNKYYDRMFIKGSRQIYEDNIGSNQTMIGTAMRLLRFVNLHTNVLCWNPEESDPSKIDPITLGQLSTHFGYSEGNEKKLMRALSKIRVFDSHPLILFFNDNEYSSENYLMFHPYVCYSGKNDKMDEVYKMFVMFSSRYKHKNDEPKKLKRGKE